MSFEMFSVYVVENSLFSSNNEQEEDQVIIRT